MHVKYVKCEDSIYAGNIHLKCCHFHTCYYTIRCPVQLIWSIHLVAYTHKKWHEQYEMVQQKGMIQSIAQDITSVLFRKKMCMT